jgi:hypothetical protein
MALSFVIEGERLKIEGKRLKMVKSCNMDEVTNLSTFSNVIPALKVTQSRFAFDS